MDNMMTKFQGIPLGEKIILIAAPIFFIDSFLHWYSASVCIDSGVPGVGEVCASGSASGWDAPGAIWSIFAVLVALIMGAQIVLARFTAVEMPKLPEGVTWARVHVGLAGLAVLFILIKLINHSGDLAVGFFIGLIVVAALAVGAGLLYRDEMTARTGGGTATPPA